MHIDQILAGYADGDAISHAAMRLREIFRGWGHQSDIFADMNCVSPCLHADCRPLSEYQPGTQDICLHHYGINSPAADCFLAARARRIMVYHNITPADFFTGYDDAIKTQLTEARTRLADVARAADAVWTVSQFNATELAEAGVGEVKVLPLIFNPAPLDVAPDSFIAQKLAGPLKNILFVGRIAPNKKLEDLIEAFAWYNKVINPFSRLLIVGSNRSAPRYYTMLRMLAGDLDLPNACFEGFADTAGLAAYYRAADLYVCPSTHEGYCLPLLEAMHCGVPVIARRAGGMPEALAGAGIMYEDAGPRELAKLMHRALEDTTLRNEVLVSQKTRMQREYARPVEDQVRNLLADWI